MQLIKKQLSESISNILVDENREWINFVIGRIVVADTYYAVQVVMNIIENGGEITLDTLTKIIFKLKCYQN